MQDIGSWIERCCRRLNRGVALKVIAEWLAVWLCVFGTLILAVKIGLPMFWPGILWFAITMPVLLWCSVQRSRSERFLATDGAALLDERLRAGGLLMTVAERPDGDWQQSLPRDVAVWEAALPRLRPKRFFRIVTLPVLFAVIAFVVPARAVPTDPSTRKRPSLQAVAELPEMLTELKKADVLDAAESDYLQQEIDKLVESTAKSPPTAEHWRKIDALRARLRNRLETEIRTIEKGRNAAQRLAQADEKGRPPLTKEQREQLEKDLNDALNRLAKQGKSSLATKIASAENTASKSETPRPTSKTEPQKTGLGNSPLKTPATKSPAKTPPATKTGIAKTGASQTTVKKTGGGKTGGSKTARVAKTGRTLSKTSSQKPIAKTGANPKSGNGPKSAGAAKTAKTPEKSAAKQPAGQMPDLKSLLEMASKLPPEAQQELMKMALSGKFSMPEHPAARELLMQQVQQMLEQESGQLEQLQKKFSQLTGGSLRPEDLRIPPGLESLIPNAQKSGNGAGRNPDGSVNTARQPNGEPPKSQGALFRDIVLPPGLLDKPRTDIDHLTGRSPTVNPIRSTTDPSGNPTTKTDGSPGGESWKRTVRPRHRRLVGEYFRAEPKKTK